MFGPRSYHIFVISFLAAPPDIVTCDGPRFKYNTASGKSERLNPWPLRVLALRVRTAAADQVIRAILPSGGPQVKFYSLISGIASFDCQEGAPVTDALTRPPGIADQITLPSKR